LQRQVRAKQQQADKEPLAEGFLRQPRAQLLAYPHADQ
jgi:hypothetical protein